MKNRQVLKIVLILCFSLNLNRAFGAEIKNDIGCLTYALEDASDKLTGKFPTLEEWVWRVVNLENFTLKMSLNLSSKKILFKFHLHTINENQSKITELANFVWHICSTKISPYEESILAFKLRQIAGAID